MSTMLVVAGSGIAATVEYEKFPKNSLSIVFVTSLTRMLLNGSDE